MSFFYLVLFVFFRVGSESTPLGCTEDENEINLNWPFFTIPVGRIVEYSEDCDLNKGNKISLGEAKAVSSGIIIRKEKEGILIKKEKTYIKKFYPTEDLSSYAGIRLGSADVRKDSKIILTLKQFSGEGLFLLVLKKGERLFFRQIIIGAINCPVTAEMDVEEFFEVPYKKGDFEDGTYETSLYLLNYNEMKWMIMGFEIR